MKIELHPHGLISKVCFARTHFFGAYETTREDSDGVMFVSRRDNDVLDEARSTEVCSPVPEPLRKLNLPDDELLAVAAMMAYVHECGEHVSIEGMELNHHKPYGIKNAVRVIEHVLTWLKYIEKFDKSNDRSGTP